MSGRTAPKPLSGKDFTQKVGHSLRSQILELRRIGLADELAVVGIRPEDRKWAKSSGGSALEIYLLEESFEWSIKNVRNLLFALQEHSLSAGALLTSSHPSVVSVAVLVRAATEAAVRIAYLFDPRASHELRSLRSVAFELESREIGDKTVRETDDSQGASLSKFVGEAEVFRARLRAAGYSVQMNAKNTYSLKVERGKLKTAVGLNLTDLSKKHLPIDTPMVWQTNSGAVHSSGWYLDGINPTDDGANLRITSTHAAVHAFYIYDLVGVVLTSIADYLGTDSLQTLSASLIRETGRLTFAHETVPPDQRLF